MRAQGRAASRASARAASPRFWLRIDVIATAAATVVLLPATIVSLVQADGPPLVVVAAIALFVGLHAASFVAVRHPRPAFVAAALVMLALALLPADGVVAAALYPSAAAFLLCLGQVAVQCTTRLSLAALGVGVMGAGIVSALATDLPDPLLRLGSFVGLAAVNAAAWAFGALERSRRIRVEDAARMRAEQAVIAERGRISRDLHDVVAHALTVMIAQAEVARTLLREDPPTSERALDIVTRTGREALRGMRGVVADEASRSPAPDLAAVRSLVEDARSPRVDIELDESGVPVALGPGAMLALHHVVREALTNAIRHTRPPVRVTVALRWERSALEAVVEDDGGAGRRDFGLGSGTGLVGLAERVRLAGGVLTAGPSTAGRDRAWTVRAVFPYGDGGAARGATEGRG
ncbi:sensor histidine kinase [Microbacterium resistens]|uniref:sensor histidine kinase n=1 Tax=Microbacterium resistens TaxID=156977 RepID=UPI00082B528C|nr:histidine kinase [Microbacterium resistens]